MTYDCFVLNIQRIQKEFKTVFGAEKLALVQKKFEPLLDDEWIKVCEMVIGYERGLPTLKEFEKYGQEYLDGHKSKFHSLGDYLPKEQAKCFDCGDSGFVRMYRNPDFEPWAQWPGGSGPCHCARGKLLFDIDRKRPESRRIGYTSNFNELWARSYTIIPHYQIDPNGDAL